MDEHREQRRGAKKHALIIVGVLLLVSIPFAWSVFSEYRSHQRYVHDTLEEPTSTPPWREAPFDVEACVGAGIDWMNACPGFEEFCRRSMPRTIRHCLDSRERSVWCADHHEELMLTKFGYEQCEERVKAGQIQDHRHHRQRCALAYRTAADWCLDRHPPATSRLGEEAP